MHVADAMTWSCPACRLPIETQRPRVPPAFGGCLPLSYLPARTNRGSGDGTAHRHTVHRPRDRRKSSTNDVAILVAHAPVSIVRNGQKPTTGRNEITAPDASRIDAAS